MEIVKLARGLAVNRISFGAGLILVPRLYVRSWVGAGAAGEDSLPARIFAAATAAGSAAIAGAYVRAAARAPSV